MFLFDEIFLKLFNLNVTASWLILAVLVFRFILKKAPKWINCMLWLLVAVRLVCPFSFESVLSLVPSAETITEQNFYYSSTPTISSGVEAFNRVVNPIISESLAPDPSASVNPTQILGFTLGVIWLIGALLMLLYAVISYIKLKKQVRTAIPLNENQWICDEVKSPFILGVFRPRIYLPSDLTGETLKHVIAHEKAHLKRKDHLWKPIGFILLSVYWFNPLMWLSYILLCRDIELACDEKVIKQMEGTDKKAYSEALLSCSAPQRMITVCPVAFGEVGVKQRIKSVLSYKKPAFWVILIAVVASIVVAVCFMTDPVDKTNGGNDMYTWGVDEEHINPDTVWEYNPSMSSYGHGTLQIIIDADYESFEAECEYGEFQFISYDGMGIVHSDGLGKSVVCTENDNLVWRPDNERMQNSNGEEIRIKVNLKNGKTEEFRILLERVGSNSPVSTYFKVSADNVPVYKDGVGAFRFYLSEKLTWLYNPYAGATQWYITKFSLPEGYTIQSAECTDGETSVEDKYYSEPEGEKCVHWSPDSVNADMMTFADLTVHALYNGEKVDLTVRIKRLGEELMGTVFSIEPLNCKITVDGLAQYVLEPLEEESENGTELTLKKDIIPNTSSWKTEGLKRAGLVGIEIGDKYKCSFGNVYLLFNNFPSSNYRQTFIAVETNETVLLKEVETAYETAIKLCDVDGEPEEEIVLQQLVGASGGAGAHISTIYKITEKGLDCIFNSEKFNNKFDSKLEAPFLLKINNSIINYEFTIDCKNNEDYIGAVFDEEGNPTTDYEVIFDSFYKFEPKDTDSDGVYEIECMQYASLYSHADYIGSARSVLKYDKNSGEFRVAEADFIVVTE